VQSADLRRRPIDVTRGPLFYGVLEDSGFQNFWAFLILGRMMDGSYLARM
jgi:hypothetical protein